MTQDERTLADGLLEAHLAAALPRMAGGSEQGEGAAAGAAGAGGEGEGGEPPALERLASAFESFKTDVTGRFDSLTERIPAPAAAAAEEEDEGDDELGYEFDFEDDDYDEEGALTPEASMKAMQQMMRQVAQEAMQPHLERQQDERRDEAAAALEERYPKLREEKFQDEMIGKTIAFARDLGVPALAREPGLLEIVYLAHEAMENGANEVPAGSEREVVLSRSGAAGGAGEDQEDEGDKIVAAANKGRFRLGS